MGRLEVVIDIRRAVLLWQTRAARNGTPSAQAVKAGLAELPRGLKEAIAEGGWSFYDDRVPEEMPPVGACHEEAPWCPSLVQGLRMDPELLGAEVERLERYTRRIVFR